MRSLLSVLFLLLGLSAYSQISDTIYVESDNVNIHTVLTKPDKKSLSTLAVIIGGSGPTDLNGNQPNMKNNSLLFLSKEIVSNGIATVRFDKRGVAKSSYRGFNESGLVMEQYADDVSSIIDHYKQIGYKEIYLIGHSEGSLIGLISSQKSDIKGFISISGAGNSADVLLKEQLKPKLPPPFYNQVVVIIDRLKNGQTVSDTPPQLNSLFRQSVQPYLISWFKYQPTALIKNIGCPSLIINGNKDIQVNAKEAELLHAAASNSQLVIIDKMNHVLKTVDGDMQANIATYTNPDMPISEVLVQKIVEFIKR